MGISTKPASRGRRPRFRSLRRGLSLGVLSVMVLSATMVASTGTTLAAGGGGPKTFLNNNDVAIPDHVDSGNLESTIAVSGLTGNITDVDVYMYVSGNDADLDAAVLSPIYQSDNTSFAYLFSAGILSGTDIGTDCGANVAAFDDAASDPIDSGTAPYEVGQFKPSPNTIPPSPLSTFNGLTPANANGDWVLDFINSGTQPLTINCWTLVITTAEDGQQFFSQNTPEGAGPDHLDSQIGVSGMVGSLSQITVSLWIQHPDDSDLQITLIAPNDKQIKLVAKGAATGQNFGTGCNTATHLTKFSDASSKGIGNYSAPYLGTYRSNEPLAQLKGLSGDDLNGQWTLEIRDSVATHAGFLHCWSMSLGTSALSVQPRMAAPPLRSTYNQPGFLITNTSDDTMNNVVVTMTLAKNFADVRVIPDYYPGCNTLHLNVVTCSFASISPHSFTFGGAMARTTKPLNGKWCYTTVATADGVMSSSRTTCFKQSSYSSPDNGNGYGIGKLAHNLVLKDQNGNTRSLYEFAGKYVLLQFTATWCGPSNFEVPNDRDEIKDLNDNNTMGVPVVFLSVLIDGPNAGTRSTKANALNWFNHFHLVDPVLYTQPDIKNLAILEHTTYSVMAGQPVETYPTSVFIRPDGTIFDIRVGAHPDDDTTTRFMNDLP